jgi:hypothetical protein
MIATTAISSANIDAIKHLSKMAALYGYELRPVLPPVMHSIDKKVSIKHLISKRKWDAQDTKAAIDFCERNNIGRIPGLIDTLKLDL